jgi:hypothetical protein
MQYQRFSPRVDSSLDHREIYTADCNTRDVSQRTAGNLSVVLAPPSSSTLCSRPTMGFKMQTGNRLLPEEILPFNTAFYFFETKAPIAVPHPHAIC